MQNQVLKAVELCLIDTSFIALDATHEKANVPNNKPKCFCKNKFSKEHKPKVDKAYDEKYIYNTVKDIYHGDCFIPLNTRNTKNPKKLPVGNIICEVGLAMNKDGKTKDNGRTGQKFCCPFRQSKKSECPCAHKNWNNGKKNRGCTKYITISDDYRLSLDRSSIAFKSVYRPYLIPFQSSILHMAIIIPYFIMTECLLSNLL